MRVRRFSAAVTIVALLLTGLLSWSAYTANRHDETRLLRLKVSETGALIQAILPTIETPLASAAEIAESSKGSAGAFTRYIQTYVGKNGPFGSASLWRVTGPAPQLIVKVGAAPRLATEPATAKTFLMHAISTSGVSILGLLHGQPRRLGYGYSVSGERPVYVVYAEALLPSNPIVAAARSNSPFSDLRFALYLGRTTDSAALLEANRAALGSNTASTTVSFGDQAFTVRAATSHGLTGTLSASLWWLTAIAGTVLSFLAGAIAERLLRRRIVAETLAVELRRSLGRQETVSRELQRALVPTLPERVDDIRIATRYQSGVDQLEVGGDWYDAIPLGDGVVFVAIGDVSGRGIAAGTVMASLRSATRAFLSEGHGPGSVLTKLSSMVDVTRDGHYATALFGVIDLKRRRLRLASAGHLAPVLITAGKPELVDIAVGPPVGAASERTHYVETTVALPPDGQLLLFTDGLVERRGESIDEGLERLLSWVRTIVAAHPATDIEILLGTLMDHTRDDGIKDDTAVMGAQWTS